MKFPCEEIKELQRLKLKVKINAEGIKIKRTNFIIYYSQKIIENRLESCRK